MECIFQHLPPACRIGKSDSHGVLHEGRCIGGLSDRDERAYFLDLIVRKGNGDLDRRHTKYHTKCGPPRCQARTLSKSASVPGMTPVQSRCVEEIGRCRLPVITTFRERPVSQRIDEGPFSPAIAAIGEVADEWITRHWRGLRLQSAGLQWNPRKAV